MNCQNCGKLFDDAFKIPCLTCRELDRQIQEQINKENEAFMEANDDNR